MVLNPCWKLDWYMVSGSIFSMSFCTVVSYILLNMGVMVMGRYSVAFVGRVLFGKGVTLECLSMCRYECCFSVYIEGFSY